MTRDRARLTGVGYPLFALTVAGLGIAGLAWRGFGPLWNPIPQGAPERDLLPFICSAVFIACGVGLMLRGARGLASRLLLAFLLVWWLAFRIRAGLGSPTVVGYWENAGETTVIVAAVWTLYAGFATDWDRRIGFATGVNGLRIAGALFGLAMIAFGFAHLAYIKYTATLVPKWLPNHEGWVVLTGWSYVLAGVGILTSIAARLAATLVAWQIAGLTLLVWAPQVWHGSKDPDVWSETLVSWALTTGAWVVADSYRGASWLGETVKDDRESRR